MFAWFNDLLVSTSNFMPHGACYLWLPSLLWLHIISDSVIAIAYYSIPVALLYFVKKRIDLSYRWMFVLLGISTFLCGTTHLISIWTIWHPDYWLDGLIKFAAALISIVTALLLWPLVPKLLRLPSPQALKTSETYLRAIFNATPDAMLICNEQGIITMVNQQAECLLGYKAHELIGQSIEILVPERFRAAHPTQRAQFAATPFTRTMGMEREVLALRKDNSEFDVDIRLSPIQTEQGLFFASALRDITQRKQAEVALRESEARYRAVAQSANDAIIIVGSLGTIVSWNRGAEIIFGYTEAEINGLPVFLLMPHQYRPLHLAGINRVMSGGEPRVIGKTVELEGLRKDQSKFPLELSLSQWQTSEGWFCSGFIRDITERKSAEEKIKQLAFYDQLTLLPNRRLLLERLKYSIEIERREGKQLALLMLDLDRFKAINDSLGHLVGDELLQQVAARITTRLRDVDMVARLGGDEFIVLLEDITHPQDAARMAKEIITDLSKPFKLTQSDNVQVGVSIGISLYPQHGDSLEILMDHADAALYQAKDQGRGCFAYFSEDLTIAARERIELENRLRQAIQQQELRVFYQPQMDIASGRMVGAEALVRWQDPTEGLIPPSRFIPIAEETNLIMEIGEWVLRETCRQGRQWLDMGLPPLTLAVNVSPHQFRRSDINALVTTVLAETGFPAGQLELEITESGLMENQDNATDILNSLRDLGIHLAIDDFGTGYSSLAYLKHFPLDVLKIDKTFIDDIPHNKDDMEIAATIIAMGHTLGFKVLAEGVETIEQLSFLSEQGCDLYQGYLISKPLDADSFAKLLDRGNKHA